MKRHNDAPIKDVLKQWVQSPKIKPHLVQQKLEAHWEEWFGKLIAKNTERVSIKDNVLYIHIKSGPVKYEMQLNREKIMHLIHQKLGENFFDQIIVQ